MDEDGFYLGELNGIRGLVPSNFLQPAPHSADHAIHSSRPKGVAFCSDINNSDYQIMPKTSIGNKKGTIEVGGRGQPEVGGRGQQQQLTSSNVSKITGGIPSTSTKSFNKMSIPQQSSSTTTSIPAKSLIKKSSDLSNKTIQQQQQTIRKGSHAGAKGPHSVVKVDNIYFLV